MDNREQQNERYDLSKQVDEIGWQKNENGTYNITHKNYNDSKATEIFDKILKNATGFTNREGNQTSIELDKLNEQNETKINAKYDAELAELEKQQPPQGKGEGDWSAELKEELEKGLVAEKFKKFKKDLAKDLGVHEYGAKVAEAEYKEFLEMLKSVKKNDSADEDRKSVV